MILFFVYLGEAVALLKSEVKSQEKLVKALKKRSLWSRTLEEVFLFLPSGTGRFWTPNCKSTIKCHPRDLNSIFMIGHGASS